MSQFFFLGDDLTKLENYRIPDPADPTKTKPAPALPGGGDTVSALGASTMFGSMSFDTIIGGALAAGTLTVNTADGASAAGGTIQASNATGGVSASDGGHFTISGNVTGGAAATGGGTIQGATFSGGAVSASGDGSVVVADEIVLDSSAGGLPVSLAEAGDGGQVQVGTLHATGSDGFALDIDGGSLVVANFDAHTVAQTSTVTISAGGWLEVDSPFSLGSQTGDNMTITITDTDSALNYSGDIVVGGVGRGQLNIRGGSNAVVDGLLAGQGIGSSGGISVGDAGTAFEVANDVVLGQGGTGGLIVTNDAEMTVDGDLTTRQQSGGSSQSGFLVTNGGVLTVNGLTTIGKGAVDALSQLYGGGTLNALGGLTIADYTGGSQLSFWLQDDSKLYTGSSTVRIGSAGRGLINLFDDSAFLSDGGGTVILGDRAGSSGKLNVGFLGSDSMDGSVGFKADDLTVGKGGSGVLDVSGHRDAIVEGDLYVGAESGSSGDIAVEKGGHLRIHRALLGLEKNAWGSISVDGRSTLSDSASVHSLLQFDGIIGIGDGGTGQFSVTNGADVKGTGTGAELLVGIASGTTGQLWVSGAGTTLAAQNLLFGGAQGIGTGNIQGGATVTIRDKLSIGSGVAPSSDTAHNALLVVGEWLPLENYTADGARDTSKLTVEGEMNVGTKAGDGSLWVTRGAGVAFQSTVTVGDNKGGGTLELIDGGTVTLKAAASLTIGAEGTVNARAGGGGIDSGAAITNNGDIEVHEDSELTIKAKSIGGAGQMFIDYDAVLTLSGSVAAGQSVTFNAGPGGNGQLILGDAAHFKGTIESFEAGDGIGLLGLTAESVKTSGTKATFTLSDHSKIVLNFDVHIDAGDFVLKDGIAGSVIMLGGKSHDVKGTPKDDTLLATGDPDHFNGLAGTDIASYAKAPAAVVANLGKPSLNSGFAADDSYTSIEGLRGSRFSDTLVGNGGGNILGGGLGKDVLTGGGGKDFFLFDTKPNTASNRDRITDFNVAQDTIQLDHSVFSAIDGRKTLSAEQFFKGAAAHDGDDRIIYDARTGVLTYDTNGNDHGGAVEIAQLGKHLALTHADFFIV